jgi:hypothetical protein
VFCGGCEYLGEFSGYFLDHTCWGQYIKRVLKTINRMKVNRSGKTKHIASKRQKIAEKLMENFVDQCRIIPCETQWYYYR